MKRENFYRRSPGDFLGGMVGMTLEERGVYNTIVDLLYLTWRPLEDSRAYIAAHCGCAVQKLNPIIASLIAKKKLIQFEEDGVTYLSNRRFEDERREVKGPTPSRSGRGKGREKSGEVREKSASVEQNPPLCGDEVATNQSVTPLEKTRVEKTREISVPNGTGGKPPSDDLADLRALDPKTGAWRLALKVLMSRGGYSEARARPLVGKWAKDHTTEELRQAGEAAWTAGTLDPVSYITETLKRLSAEAADPMLNPEQWRQRKWMEEFVEGRFQWNPQRGPEPGQPGCRVSAELQREFGIEPAKPQPVARTA